MTEEPMHDDSFERLLREAAAEYHQPSPAPRQEMWQRVQATRAARAARGTPPRRAIFPLVWAAGIAASIAAGTVLGVGLGRLAVTTRPAPAAPATLSDAHTTDDTSAAPDSVRGEASVPTPDVGAHAIAPIPSNVPTAKRGHRRKVVRAAAPVLVAGPVPQAKKTVPPVYQVALADHLGQAEVFLTLFRLSVQRGSANPLASATARRLLATNRLLLDLPVGADRQMRTLLEDLELTLVRIAQTSPQSKRDDLRSITTSIERAGVLSRVRNGVPAGLRLTVAQGAL